MKTILAICALLCVATVSYCAGHANGYKDGQHDSSSFSLAPQSHCYVPGEAHTADTLPCVTINGGAQ
jgi:hypothetical protein